MQDKIFIEETGFTIVTSNEFYKILRNESSIVALKDKEYLKSIGFPYLNKAIVIEKIICNQEIHFGRQYSLPIIFLSGEFNNITIAGENVIIAGGVFSESLNIKGEYEQEFMINGGVFKTFIIQATFNEGFAINDGVFNEGIKIQECNFKKDFTISGGDFIEKFVIQRGVFEDCLNINGGNFEKDFIISGGKYEKNCYVEGTVFNGDFLIKEAVFDDQFEILNGNFESEFKISGGGFDKFAIGGGVFKKKITFEGETSFQNFEILGGTFEGDFLVGVATFHQRFHIKGGAFNALFSIDDGNFSKGVTIQNSSFKNFIIKSGNFNGDFSIAEKTIINDFTIFHGQFVRPFIIYQGAFKGIFRILNGTFCNEFKIGGGTFRNPFQIWGGLFKMDFVITGGIFENSFNIRGGTFESKLFVSSGDFLQLFIIEKASFESVVISFINLRINCLLFKNSISAKTIVIEATSDTAKSELKYLLFLCLDLFSTTLLKVRNLSLNNLYFSGLYNFSNVIFSGISFKELKEYSIPENENLQFKDLNEKEFNYILSGNITANSDSFQILNSDLGKTTFIDCDFEKMNLDFRSSKITEVFLAGTKMPKYIITTDEKQKQLGYAQLKKIYENRGDFVSAQEYYSREMNAYTKTLRNEKRRRAERFNLWGNKFSTNHGQNWMKGFIRTTQVGIGFYILYCWCLGFTPTFNINRETFLNFWYCCSHILEFFSPIHKTDFLIDYSILPKTTFVRLSLGIGVFIDGLSRIVLSYFIYQLIQAFRKHGKK